MRATKSLLGLAAIFASLVLLGGCGGGGDSDSTSATSASGGDASSASTASGSAGEQASTTSASANQKSAESKTKPAKGEKPQKGGADGSKAAKPSGSAPTDPSPLPNEGTDGVAPEVPTTAGGDNSIQEYGVEADSAERIEVAQIVGSYLAAQASGEWETACSYLATWMQDKLKALAESSSASAGNSCAGALAGLLSKKSQAERQSAAEINVLSMRVGGPQAFIIYRDGTGAPFNLPLRSEGGQWWITSLAPIGLAL